VKSLIRLASEQDAAGILAIYGALCASSPITFEEIAPSSAEIEQRIRKVTAQFPWLICERDGGVAGYVYASPHRERAAYRWSVDVAVYVAETQRRAGIGRALYTALFQMLRVQGYHRAYAGITVPNPASVGLHEALGFALVGIYRRVGYKSGEWRDVGWWDLAMQPDGATPGEPLSVQKILNTESWRKAIAAGESLLRP
jgi:phosphinothricin acetyltransferase